MKSFLLHTTNFFSKWLCDRQDQVHQPKISLNKNKPQWFRRQLCIGVLNHPYLYLYLHTLLYYTGDVWSFQLDLQDI